MTRMTRPFRIWPQIYNSMTFIFTDIVISLSSFFYYFNFLLIDRGLLSDFEIFQKEIAKFLKSFLKKKTYVVPP